MTHHGPGRYSRAAGLRNGGPNTQLANALPPSVPFKGAHAETWPVSSALLRPLRRRVNGFSGDAATEGVPTSMLALASPGPERGWAAVW